VIYLLLELRDLGLLSLHCLHVLAKGGASRIVHWPKHCWALRRWLCTSEIRARPGGLGLSPRLLGRSAPSQHLRLQLSIARFELTHTPLEPLGGHPNAPDTLLYKAAHRRFCNDIADYGVTQHRCRREICPRAAEQFADNVHSARKRCTEDA